MVGTIGQGIINVLNPSMFPWLLLGVIIGLIVGILPGFGVVAALSVLLPIIYGLSPSFALFF